MIQSIKTRNLNFILKALLLPRLNDSEESPKMVESKFPKYKENQQKNQN